MGVADEFAGDDVPRAGVPDAIVKLKELEKRLKQEPNNLGLRVQVAGMLREAGRSVEAVTQAFADAQPQKDSVVVITADAAAPVQSVITAMEAARRAGLGQITFTTQNSAHAGPR